MARFLNVFNQLGMDFSKKRVIIVEARCFKGELVISNKLLIENLQEENLEYIFSKLENKIKVSGIRSRRLNLVLENDEFVYEKIRLPFLDKKKIFKILKNKYEDSEVLNRKIYNLQYVNSGYNKRINQNEIMVIGIDKKKAKNYYDLSQKIGLKPINLSLRADSIRKYLSYKNTINDRYKFSELNVLKLIFDRDKSEIIIFKKGNINFLNSIDNNFNENQLNDLLESENIDKIACSGGVYSRLDEILSIVGINLDIFTRENEEEVNLILISGELSYVKGLDRYISKELSINTIALQGENKYMISIGSLVKIGRDNYEY